MMVNGTGGQPDNHGRRACPTGRAIIVLRATARGAVSNRAQHEAGTLITIPRYLADTVITEFNIARLMDKITDSVRKNSSVLRTQIFVRSSPKRQRRSGDNALRPQPRSTSSGLLSLLIDANRKRAAGNL